MSRARTLGSELALAAVCAWSLAPVEGAAAQGVAPARLALQQRVDSLVAPFANAHDFMGAVLIMHGGRVVARTTVGPRRLRFGIGSVSKTFTAAAIEALAAAGRLRLTDRLHRYVPEFTADTTVTIEQLLAHAGGIPDYYGLPEYAAGREKPISLAAFAAMVSSHPLDFVPGKESRYSNSGYKLLALVIERASGEPFSRYIARAVASPAKVPDIEFLHDGVAPRDLARGQDAGFAPSWLQSAPPVSVTWAEGAGSMMASADALARWGASERLRHDATKAPWYGWGERTRFGVRGFEQTGRVPMGYASFLGVYPDSAIVIVALSSVQSAAVDALGLQLAAAVFAPDAPVVAPAAPPLRDVRGVALDAYAGRYEIAPGFVLQVGNSARGLLLAGPDGAFLPLNAVEPPRFFFRTLYVPIRFLSDSGGRIAGLDWAGQVTARRIP